MENLNPDIVGNAKNTNRRDRIIAPPATGTSPSSSAIMADAC
jgi:hypothetical protein